MTWQPGATTVIDDATARHLAFPFALTTQAGTQIATYRVGTAHGVQPSGYVVASRSTDGGATWQAPVVLSNCEGDERSAKLAQAPDGTIYAAVWAWRTSDITSIRSMLRTSTDDGASWSYPQPLAFPHASWSACTGLLWHDGRLVAAAYGSDGGEQYVALSDGTAVASGGGNWQEPALVASGDELLCFLRYEYGSLRRICLSRSLDGGATWSVPQTVVNGGGQPAPFIAPDGTWLLAYRDTESSAWSCRYAWSTDAGATWQDGGNFSGSTRRYVYADWLTFGDDLGLVYALESGDDADTYLTRFVMPAPAPTVDLALAGKPVAGDVVAATITVNGVTRSGEATIQSVTEGPPTMSFGILASAHVPLLSYADEVAADSPVLWYKADETSGTTLVDGGGSYDGIIGNRATLAQPPLVADGGYSQSLSRSSGTNTYVTYATYPFNLPTACTIEIWAKLADASIDALQTILDKTKLSSGNGQWSIWWDNRTSQGSPQRLRALLAGVSLDWSGSAAATAIESGVHIAVVKDGGSNSYLYVNGTLRDSSTSSMSVSANNYPIGIGNATESLSSNTSFYAGMDWDWFAWYTTALSSSRIAAHYAAGA